LTIEGLERKIKTLQSSIDSLKMLFTQVLERVNVVNEENNFLRCMLIQQQSVGSNPNEGLKLPQQQPIKEDQNGWNSNMQNGHGLRLPELNHTSLHLNNQNQSMNQSQMKQGETLYPLPTFLFQNQPNSGQNPQYQNVGGQGGHFQYPTQPRNN
jgi:regulator of replication initiation timing